MSANQKAAWQWDRVQTLSPELGDLLHQAILALLQPPLVLLHLQQVIGQRGDLGLQLKQTETSAGGNQTQLVPLSVALVEVRSRTRSSWLVKVLIGRCYLGDQQLAATELLPCGLHPAHVLRQVDLQLPAAVHQGLDLRLHLANVEPSSGELILHSPTALRHLRTQTQPSELLCPPPASCGEPPPAAPLTALSSLVPRTAPISVRSLSSRLRISADLFFWWQLISCSVESSLCAASRLTWTRTRTRKGAAENKELNIHPSTNQTTPPCPDLFLPLCSCSLPPVLPSYHSTVQLSNFCSILLSYSSTSIASCFLIILPFCYPTVYFI